MRRASRPQDDVKGCRRQPFAEAGQYMWTRSGAIYAEMIMTTGDPSHARIPGRMYQKLQIVYDRSINEDSTRATTRNAPTLLSISRTSSLMIFRIINQTLPYRCRRCPECCRSRGNFYGIYIQKSVKKVWIPNPEEDNFVSFNFIRYEKNIVIYHGFGSCNILHLTARARPDR